MGENLCQRLKPEGIGQCKQKLHIDMQTFEQIPLTFPPFAGKIHVVLCTVDWGVWLRFRFIYIRQLPGKRVAPHGVLFLLSALWQFICLQLNTCVPCAAPLAKPIFYKGGALQDYGIT